MNSLTNSFFPATKSSSKAQQTLRQIADTAPMIVWMTDSEDTCIYLNPDIRAQFDRPEDLDISAWAQFIHPEDLPRVGPIVKCAKEKQHEYQVEYRIVRSDGSIRWMMGSAAPRFTADSAHAGFNGTIIDISDRQDAFERLAKSEAAYRLLTEYSSDLISHHAPGGNYLYASPSIKGVLGYEPSEVLGLNVYDIIHPEDRQAVADEIRHQTENGDEAHTVEFRMRHKHGHYLWLGTRAQVIIDPLTGERIGTVAISRDMSVERQAKEELRLREEQFHSLTKLSSDWYWETDEFGRFTVLSEGVQTSLGVTPASHLGKSRLEIATDPNQPGLLAYQNCFEQRQPFRNIEYSGSASGNIRYVRISGEPVFDAGVFKGFRGVTTDITEEKDKAERMAQLASENHALIENSPDMIVLCSAEGELLRVSGASVALVGYRPDELMASDYRNFVLPDDLEKTQQLVAHAQANKVPVQDFENRWIRKDGSIVYLSWSVRWANDSSVMYCMARDVTERYHTHAALQESKNQLNNVLESIGDGFFSIDRNWRISYANQIAADFIGRKREEFVGMRLWTALPHILDSPFLGHYRRAMEQGEQALFESYYAPRGIWTEVKLYPHAEGISVFFHDITRKREAEKAIWLSEQRFREVVEMTPAGYILTDRTRLLVDVNPALCELSGYAENELLGKNLNVLFPTDPFASATDGIPATSLHGLESIVRHKNGQLAYVLMNADIRRDGQGNVLSITAFLTDITARKEAELETKKRATHDALTGLPNRAYLDENLPAILDYSTRGQVNAVMLIDLDRFKEVNDTMGHAAGDTVLCEIANRLRQHTRKGDLVARLGGDEFVVIAPCSGGVRSAAEIAEKLIKSLAEPVLIGGREVCVGGSIGISLSQDGMTKEELLLRADKAMYQVKASGRNGYSFYKATEFIPDASVIVQEEK